MPFVIWNVSDDRQVESHYIWGPSQDQYEDRAHAEREAKSFRSSLEACGVFKSLEVREAPQPVQGGGQ